MPNQKRLLETFLTYVQVDSVSGSEAPMGELLLKTLRELGLEVRRDTAGRDSGTGDGFNVYGRLPGTLPGSPVLLVAHMDTMPPGCGIRPQVNNGLITSDGTTVLGGDDKSGVAAIVEALRSLVEEQRPHRTVEVLFTIGEETGMQGTKHLDYTWFQSKNALIFDLGGPQGTLVTQGPGQLKFKALVHGRKAHAGLAPEKGISAIQAAAKGVAAMNLLRIDEETTCNLGTFTCVGPNNVVPDLVLLQGEVRSRSLEKLNRQAAHLKQCLQEACDAAGAVLDWELVTNYTVFQVPAQNPFVREVGAVYQELGFTPAIQATGGGSDANVLALHGFTPLLLSTGMSKVQTTEEELRVKDLEDTCTFIHRLLTQPGKN